MNPDNKSAITLYFIVDPLCGWTYAAQPIFKQAISIKNINIQVYSGGMLAFKQKREINKDWQSYVTPNDQRIEQISGMPFGGGYQKLLGNTGHVLDSEPPSKAMLVAQRMTLSSMEMLAAIQEAHFVQGLDISDGIVLSQLATHIGLEPYTFLNRYQQLNIEDMTEHFNEAANLLNEVNAQCYPSAIIEIADQRELLNLDRSYGKPLKWKQALVDKISDTMAEIE